ncbi:E3 ubiquitin-protein ligase UBR1 isoform X2 [Bactrocera dorsalis]|uniref:E3 ubiquitin-protein ligase n=1 Tax=Bactrocera dorsalis TaxID=27457 RepID=A0A6I9UTC5_BACDO|nr:E3 ubiquitin-protein ligase UBR1 isoform X2 [Bactrocera dorsalis]XP_049310478.1 E3 ubiquitin-protein ligase UBR1 isoform X2 [Bactrocera dorsalis]
MDRFDLEDVVAPPTHTADAPLKDWRLKYQAGTIKNSDFTEFFQKQSRKYFHFRYEREQDATRPSLKITFNEAGAKEHIINVLMEFVLGDNPTIVLDKLQQEGNTATVCGKVFKNGEPTYSCRECGMDPTCVLCVNCFKQSAHRYHKYKMSTSGGGGCCDCGDEEAWKKDHYCEEHLRGKENPISSTIITDAIQERCELTFNAILTFCVNFLEIEPNASLECLDGDSDDGQDECFCTVLYNDESHTFDQVIQTLTKIAKCRQKDAMEIVASIDREGRAVVKCDSFSECQQLQEAIEKQAVTVVPGIPHSRANQSLRVSVLNIRAVACQQFALQLLTWFQEFLIKHSIFRKIFARLIMDRKPPYCIRHILEYDVKLWKTARACWHRLLISGLLMEYDNKMALAQEFSKHYASIVQDFIRDDHEHSCSIVSLSVQLFTVPSIAHYLMANEGIFHKLLHTFYHASIETFIKNKTLQFSKNINAPFKRAAYILYDLRYILSFKPDVWTDGLREGFLEGCKALLKLLNVMQGMESTTRQTGQHMDYEPEWECAFNLHIKLATAITLVLEWCSTDLAVLTKLYQMVMRYLVSNTFIVDTTIKREERHVAGHVAECIIYDVASRPVSIHLPLSRFFAGIYLHLGAYGLTFDNAVAGNKRTPEEIMEPILCTQTMIAQVHAGMWRRNGYSLLHQLYFYRIVRCRTEMLDRDIIGLQIGAALIESNQYLIHILNKFNLIKWIQPDYEKNSTAEAVEDDFLLPMIEEFLELLIVIIGERYVPGISNVAEEDRTKKEIIQLLCIRPYSHSELNRALPDALNETAVEDVIDTVAVFKKPQRSDSRGVYQLKEELYENYNMYFYHYTKEEKSKSEETQRLRRKNKNELVCCPPPKLPKLTDGFVSIANLLQCDVMMTILTTVLDRAIDLTSNSFAENHLQEVLFLIGYGLQEEQSGYYPFLSFYEQSQKYNMLSKLEELSRSSRVEAHRDFILWTIQKFKELQAKGKANEADVSTMLADGGEEVEISRPLTAAEKEKQEKEERARLAAERRAKIMAQMQNAQNNFMKSNAEMFASANVQASGSRDATTAMEWQEDVSNMDEEGAVAYNSQACLGVERRLQQPEEQSFKCILCFEDCTVSKDGPTLVYSAFVQKSKVLPPDAKYACSVHTSSCGHVMHINCWQEYYTNEETKEQRRPHRNRQPFPQASQNTEFQCPYCRCLSNSVLPLSAPLSKYSMPLVIHKGEDLFPIDMWIEVMKTLGDELILPPIEGNFDRVLPLADAILSRANLYANIAQFERIAQPIDKLELPASWITFAQRYIKSIRQHAPADFDESEKDGFLWLIHTCIYTVRALEVHHRAVAKPFKSEMSIRQKSCISGLVRASCLYGTNLTHTDVTNLKPVVAELLDTVFKQKGSCILEWRPFSMMVQMTCLVPNILFSSSHKSVVVNGSMLDFYAVQLFFLANMVKAIVLFQPPDMDVDEDYDQEIKQLPQNIRDNIAEFYRKYNFVARQQALAYMQQQQQQTQAQSQTQTPAKSEEALLQETQSTEIDADLEVSMSEYNADNEFKVPCDLGTIAALYAHIKKQMREYLRCCCLFFHFVTEVEFPDEFLPEKSDTYENMCKYLGLETGLAAYFDSAGCYASILETFATHPDLVYCDVTTKKKRCGRNFDLVPCTQSVPRLVDLPEDYSDLINSVSEFICPNNKREEMKTPTMCMICGKIICAQSFCCQPELEGRNVGACTYHANSCAAEICVFLRIRDCQIVYLGRNKGCFVNPPYLDHYGETDQGLRRGNPLRLCPLRYSKIQLNWLSHTLHEEIARLNDNTSVVATQWHHM